MRVWRPGRIRATTGLTVIGGCLGLLTVACAPALNWREVSLADAEGLRAMFPCKPDQVSQRMSWPGGAPVNVSLWSCRAGGYLWGVSAVKVRDVTEVSVVLNGWSDALRGRSGYRVVSTLAPFVKGSTPLPQAMAFELQPKQGVEGSAKALPPGWAWHFSHGLTLFQVSVWSLEGELPTKSEDVVSTFKNGFYFQN